LRKASGDIARRTLQALLRLLVAALSVLGAFIILTVFRDVLQSDAAAPISSSARTPPPTTATVTTRPQVLVVEPVPTLPPVDCDRAAPEPGDGRMVVRVAFRCGPPGELQAAWVYREVPDSTAVLTATARQLAAGPTDAERADGFVSAFSSDTADVVSAVTIEGGAVRVEFAGLRPLPGINREPFRTHFIGDLNASLFQHDQVESVEYRLDGSCEAFWALLGGTTCDVITRAEWEAGRS
jgi:hypothetical protein